MYINTTLITPTRPCEVGGVPAFFHRFVENDRGLLQVNTFTRPEDNAKIMKDYQALGIVPNYAKVEKLRETRALIEWTDGRLATVALERVQFTDRGED